MRRAVIDAGHLDQILRAQVVLVGGLGSLGIAPQKVRGQRLAQMEVQHLHDLLLHVEDLFLLVGVVGDVDEVIDVWGKQFFVLGGNEHGRHANQLQFLLGSVDHQLWRGER